MRVTRHALIAALLAASLPARGSPQAASTNDVESVDAIITAVYDVISGEAGESRDWERFRALFAEGATLSAVVRAQDGALRRVIMTPESYVERSGTQLERNGFFESEIGRVTERFGSIAHSFSTYESRRSASDPEPFMRGINSFQLMHDGRRWWVVSIFWQAEGPDNPIPDKYIGRQ